MHASYSLRDGTSTSQGFSGLTLTLLYEWTLQFLISEWGDTPLSCFPPPCPHDPPSFFHFPTWYTPAYLFWRKLNITSSGKLSLTPREEFFLHLCFSVASCMCFFQCFLMLHADDIFINHVPQLSGGVLNGAFYSLHSPMSVSVTSIAEIQELSSMFACQEGRSLCLPEKGMRSIQNGYYKESVIFLTESGALKLIYSVSIHFLCLWFLCFSHKVTVWLSDFKKPLCTGQCGLLSFPHWICVNIFMFFIFIPRLRPLHQPAKPPPNPEIGTVSEEFPSCLYGFFLF